MAARLSDVAARVTALEDVLTNAPRMMPVWVPSATVQHGGYFIHDARVSGGADDSGGLGIVRDEFANDFGNAVGSDEDAQLGDGDEAGNW